VSLTASTPDDTESRLRINACPGAEPTDRQETRPMTESPAVDIQDVAKTYGGNGKQAEKRALKGVTLQIPKGSMFALLGPNGAGKSTLINIMAGLVVKTSGHVAIHGHDIDTDMRAARRSIGIVPQELNLDPFFTPRELLDLQAGLYGVPKAARRTDDLLRAIGLADKADAYARSLSGGMRRRLLVGKAMVHAPPVLVLDEPTAGVDVELRHQLWDYVVDLNKRGTTVLLTTHYLEEAESLCDTIAIINHGRLIACEDKRSLMRRLDSKELIVELAAPVDTIPESLAHFAPEATAPDMLTFRYAPSTTTGADILSAVAAAGLTVRDVTTHEAELEDVFVTLTRNDPGDEG
jgi:ABC-2 type transport system ATP-binding protein